MTEEEIKVLLQNPIMNPTQYLTFIGEYDSDKKYKPGDVVIKDEQTIVCTGTGFVDISEDCSTNATVGESTKILPKRCEFCGAPLVKHLGQIRCEYCGTNYD